MLATILLMVAAIAQSEPPPVPGLCSAPVPADSETPGCYLTGKIDLPDAPRTLSWHVVEYPSAAAAAKEAGLHPCAAAAAAHTRHLQAAPGGRRNLVLILAPQGRPAVVPGGAWRPTGFCG